MNKYQIINIENYRLQESGTLKQLEIILIKSDTRRNFQSEVLFKFIIKQ